MLFSDLQWLADSGYNIDFGHHVDLEGYFVAIYKSSDYPECGECGFMGPMNWNEVGHGKTLREAFENAAGIVFRGREAVKVNDFLNKGE